MLGFWIVCSFCINISYGLEDIPLEEWTTPRFSECEAPRNVTPNVTSHFKFLPNFLIIERHLGNEGNFNFALNDNPTNIHFHFYGSKYFEHPNYKISFRENGLIVEFCNSSNSNTCSEFSCEKGVVENKNVDNNVYIGWKKEKHITKIIVNIHHSLIQCSLPKALLQIKKLVMSGTKRLDKISMSKYPYNIYAKTDVINLTTTKFNLDKYIILNIFQCAHCEAVFTLKCDDFYDNSTVTSSDGSASTFNNGHVLNGWALVILPTNKNFTNLTNCFLEMVPKCDPPSQCLKPFWILAKPEIGERRQIDSAPTTTIGQPTLAPLTESHINPDDGRGNNAELLRKNVLLISFGIIIIISII